MRHGSLATLDRETGHPYASLVNFATDLAGQPVIFISGLARHTYNLQSSPKASLLAARLPPSGDVLTGARVTVLGEFEQIAAEGMAERYGDHHPQARMYLDFPDFSVWRLRARLVHGVAGFGRIETLAADEVFLPETAIGGFAELAADAATHLNHDHADAVRLYATKLLGARDGNWRCVGCDPEGLELQLERTALRLPFPQRVRAPDALRHVLKQMAEDARRAA